MSSSSNSKIQKFIEIHMIRESSERWSANSLRSTWYLSRVDVTCTRSLFSLKCTSYISAVNQQYWLITINISVLIGSDNCRESLEQQPLRPVYSSFSGLHSDYERGIHSGSTGLKPLPESFELGEIIETELPPGVIVYS